MTKKIFATVLLAMVLGVGAGFASDKPFSWTPAPARGYNIAVSLNSYNLGKYLEQSQVNRPEVLNEVKALLQEGKYYRKRTRDQKGRGTLLTIYVDVDYMMHIVTYRNETCDTCEGTGVRAKFFDKVTSKVSAQFSCPDCKGKGEVEDQQREKKFVLSPEDFESPEEGRQLMAAKAYADAPKGAEAWVGRLSSKDPRARLEACLWLDQNYVRVGTFFQDIMPMLKKARYYDSNQKKRVMVWQFWAGKDMPNERNRAYYRIYADTKSGKITSKGFYAAN